MNARSAVVFLSYASADADVARRIAGALRAAGVEAWLDESDLRGGEAWDASIRAQIRECAVFVPIVSAATNARSEGYFRLEWRLAVERSRLIADDRPFLLPVVADGTREADARVPEAFLERQWTRVADAGSLDAFAAHVRAIVSTQPAPRAVATDAALPSRHGRMLTFACAALVAIALAAAAWWMHRARWAGDAGAPGTRTIAVLPFDNLSGRDEDRYLADGLQEEIVSAIARVRDLTVISRASTREYRGRGQNVRDIGARLGAGSILQGSVRREGATLRLTVQLVDARSDSPILSENYDRDISHVLDLQSAVARQIADALSVTLTQYERGELDRVATNHGDAYDQYLRAVALFRQEAPDDEMGLVEPTRLLEASLKLDPDFADAWALLAQAHAWSYFDAPRAEEGAAAKAAFERALAIYPDLPEAKLARGVYELYVIKDLDQAIADFTAFAKLRPSSSIAESMLGFALRRKARFDEALPHFDRAWMLDPLNNAYSGGRMTTLLGLRRYPEAIAQIGVYQKRFPSVTGGAFARARLEGQMRGGDIEPLRVALRDRGAQLEVPARQAIEAEIARAEGRYRDAIALWATAAKDDDLQREETIACLYSAAGDEVAAIAAASALERDARARIESYPSDVHPLVSLALAKSISGQHDDALAIIEKARQMQPETTDAINGPRVSFLRSIVLKRAQHTDEAYAEVERLLRVPFGSPIDFFDDPEGAQLLVQGDARFDALIHHPPRL